MPWIRSSASTSARSWMRPTNRWFSMSARRPSTGTFRPSTSSSARSSHASEKPKWIRLRCTPATTGTTERKSFLLPFETRAAAVATALLVYWRAQPYWYLHYAAKRRAMATAWPCSRRRPSRARRHLRGRNGDEARCLRAATDGDRATTVRRARWLHAPRGDASRWARRCRPGGAAEVHIAPRRRAGASHTRARRTRPDHKKPFSDGTVAVDMDLLSLLRSSTSTRHSTPRSAWSSGSRGR